MKMVWIMLLVALLGANTLAYTDYSMLRVLSARNFVDFTSRSNGINLNGAKSTKFCYNYYKSMKLESNKKTEHYCPVRDSKSVLKHPTTSAQLLLRPNLNEGINSVLKASKVKEALSCWESIGLDGFPKFLSVVLEQGVDFRQMNAMHLAGRLESLLLVFDWSDTNAIAKLTKTMQLLKMSRDVVSSEFALSLSIKFQQWLSNDAPMLLPEKIMPILKRLTQLGYNRANILDSTSKSSLLTLLQNCSSFEEQCHAYDIILRSRFKVHEIPQCYFNRHFVDKLLAEDVWCNSSATQKRAQYLRILLFPKLLERVSLGRKTLIRSIDALLVKLQSIDRQELDIISLMLVLNQVSLSLTK